MKDEELYLQATEEVEGDNRNPALWAKVIALCEGNAEKAKYEYIKIRVGQLAEDTPPSDENDTADQVDLVKDQRQTQKSKESIGEKPPRLDKKDPLEKQEAQKATQSFYSKLLSGQFGLAKTYWLFGVLGSTIISIPFWVAVFSKSKVMSLVLLAFSLFYSGSVLIGVWRASNLYRGSRTLALFAKIAVVGGVLFWCLFTGGLVAGYLETLDKPHIVGESFKDCEDCPEMVVVPAGRFRMGDISGDGDVDARPVTHVTINKNFAVGKYEVTKVQFSRFVADTGYRTDAEKNEGAQKECFTSEEDIAKSWQNPGFSQSGNEPVVCISWNDARAYVDWLKQKTGDNYRLLSESEWEYLARSGNESKFGFGESESHACEHGNVQDVTSLKERGVDDPFYFKNQCTDGYVYTAPVGSFQANVFGLYDLHGNVSEWLEDCWIPNYKFGPTDEKARLGGECSYRVARGSYYGVPPKFFRIDRRLYGTTLSYRSRWRGFRVAKDLEKKGIFTGPDTEIATTDQKQLITSIQNELSRLGYKVDAENGVMGYKTSQAIKDFQEFNAYPVTGNATEWLLQELKYTTIPPLDQKFTLEEQMVIGEKVYVAKCAVCHQANGSGLPPAFPALSGKNHSKSSVTKQINIVKYGKGGMPSFILSVREITAVITYIRNAWGNNSGDVVQPEDMPKFGQ